MNSVTKVLAAGVATIAAAAPALAADAPKEARIPLAGYVIDNWRAVDRDTLLVEGRGNRWYRAELFGPCFGLPFAHSIGFVTYPGNTFDRFSKIVVRGQTCRLRSLVEVDAPPRKAGRGDSIAA